MISKATKTVNIIHFCIVNKGESEKSLRKEEIRML